MGLLMWKPSVPWASAVLHTEGFVEGEGVETMEGVLGSGRKFGRDLGREVKPYPNKGMKGEWRNSLFS